MQARFVPLTRWPKEKTPSYRRKDSPYRAGYSDTLDSLEKELKYLGAKNIVIEAGFKSSEIRNDGWPRSSARPGEPGVIVSFQSKHGPIALPCDYFKAWEDNLRAIAYHLEHLRKAGMRGVGQAGEQYRGWQQLPPTPGTISTKAEAAEYIWKNSGSVYRLETIAHDAAARDAAYREAAKRLHPDKQGGATVPMQLLNEAIRVLRSS